MVMKREAARRLLWDFQDGTIFTATFIKRTTGEKRVMNCRKGVKKHLTGAGAKYNPRAYDLVFVFDMQKEAYRSIPIDGIISLKLHGKEYLIED